MKGFLAVGAAIVALLQPQPAQIPDQWRGNWFARGATNGLERVEVSVGRIRVRWRNANVECTPAAGAPTTVQTLVSVTFRCGTTTTLSRIALTSSSETALLAHFIVRGDQDMHIVVLSRGASAARPPTTTAGEPSREAPRSALPQFPLPAPRWTARTVLSPGVAVSSEGERLGAIFDRLRAALRRADIEEWSVYAVGTDGFAVVSRLEHITDDGHPASDRWSIDSVRPRPFSVSDYLAALFKASPGRYRVIAFVVTALPVTASAEAPDREMMDRLLRSGAGDLPEELRSKSLPPSGHCEALVYEFYRASADDNPKEVNESQIAVLNHLAGAGLWTLEALNR